MIFLTTLQQKIFAIFLRVLDWFILFPKRVGRIFLHLCLPIKFFRKNRKELDLAVYPHSKIGFWFLELLLLHVDLLGLVEVYETFSDFVKWNTRALNSFEEKMARQIFRDNLNYRRIRIDEKALLGPPQYHICYVSFYTINAYGNMPDYLLIHELMHVWQYQKMGMIYIPRALAAQYSPMGYNYGGQRVLQEAIRQNKNLDHFNLEQQADIVSDYFRIKKGMPTKWEGGQKGDLATYEHLLQEVMN